MILIKIEVKQDNANTEVLDCYMTNPHNGLTHWFDWNFKCQFTYASVLSGLGVYLTRIRNETI